MKLKRPIIALDFNDALRTLAFLQNFPQNEKLFVKIGMELYYSAGQDLVKAVLAQGHDVFLDLKCHDIPHTVERAMYVLGQLVLVSPRRMLTGAMRCSKQLGPA